MNESFEVIKKIYKPYKYTFQGKAIIIESTSGNYVIKKKNNNTKKLFSYLKTRNFDNYPKLIEDDRKDINVYEYIENINYPKEQKANDLISLVAKLHYKTSYFKDVTEDNYKKIYDSILNNLNYYIYTYNKYYEEFFNEIYLSPSKYLFMRNYSKINANLNFCINELDNWYQLVKDSKKSRVSIVHNNLSLNHYLKSDKEYLISWDNYIIDTPILDLYKLYQNEYLDINFDSLFKTYFSIFQLSNDEKKLLFLLISIPPEITFDNNELNSTIKIRHILDYIYKTEDLIRPYYSKNQKEKDGNLNK